MERKERGHYKGGGGGGEGVSPKQGMISAKD